MRGTLHIEQLYQWPGIPPPVSARMEESSLPSAPLRDTHHLAIVCEHFTGALTREADQPPELAWHSAPFVHDEFSGAARSQRSRPPRPDPARRHRHIRIPQWIRPRDPGLDPKVVVRSEEHRTPAAPSSDHFNTDSCRPHRIDDLDLLGAPENQGRVAHLLNDCTSIRQSPERRHIEQGQRARFRISVRVRTGPERRGR